MKMTFLLALAATVVATSAMASEPTGSGTAAAKKAPVHSAGNTDFSTRALKNRYPARPAEFRADGSVWQYLGASHLMQTVVRIGADGKLEALCTSDDDAAREFIQVKAESGRALEPGDDQ